MCRFAAAVVVLFAVLLVLVRSDAQDKPAEPKPVDYLIVSADSFADVGKEWAAWRTEHGRTVQLLKLSEIKKDAAPSLEEIREAVRKQAGGETPREGFQLLLIGDCPNEKSESYDAKTEIPWYLTPQMDSCPDETRRVQVPTDNFLADLVDDPDHKPDIAVGRIPARTLEQARIALAKVKAYETAKAGEWMRNLTFFAGEGHFGEMIDTMLEGLFMKFADQTISQDYNLRMTYANIKSSYAYAPSRFSKKVVEEANAGALLLCYMGHGSHDRLDNMYVQVADKKLTYPILTGDDVKDFAIPDGKLPVMLIVACDTGYMDHAKGSLAERVVFGEKAPVAVLASSRNSHPYANTLLQKAFISEITERRRTTLGEAMILAKRELVEAKDKDRKSLDNMAKFILPSKAERVELNRSHISMYNLCGDPGLQLRHPTMKFSVTDMTVGDITPGGTLKLMVRAPGIHIPVGEEKVVPKSWRIEVQSRRTAIPGKLKPAPGDGDLVSTNADVRKAAEDVVSENHAISNAKTVDGVKFNVGAVGTRVGEKKMQETHIEGVIPSTLPPGNYLIKVYVPDENSAACGFTSLGITVKEAPKKDGAPDGEAPKKD